MGVYSTRSYDRVCLGTPANGNKQGRGGGSCGLLSSVGRSVCVAQYRLGWKLGFRQCGSAPQGVAAEGKNQSEQGKPPLSPLIKSPLPAGLNLSPQIDKTNVCQVINLPRLQR